MYNLIFFTNVLRLLDEKKQTKSWLAQKADVSISFLSDLTNGKANPSLKTMGLIADALETPLPMLLESTDLDGNALAEMSEGRPVSALPPGYTRICVILPDRQAYIVRKWDEAARHKLHGGT
ncbi:transcriptional regulator [Ralstonia pickettii]|uniref:transcriptional regulator n=1 Tax=Ralstonia pickettii TaxID=329 RepID=UPI001BE48A90|nr:transcriptional regulator [Ralstonia pickettii]